jgi:hypothetical protein
MRMPDSIPLPEFLGSGLSSTVLAGRIHLFMRATYPEQFSQRTTKIIQVIRSIALHYKEAPLQAAARLATVYSDYGIKMWIIAAGVEIVAPSPEPLTPEQ